MNTIEKVILRERIKEVRKSRGITQEQLAEKVGIGTSNISYIENGKFAPIIENFEKIVQALDVEPYELYMFAPQKPINEIKQELYAALEKDDELLRLIYKFYLTLK